MSRILRVPPSLDKFFRPLHGYFHWDDCTYSPFARRHHCRDVGTAECRQPVPVSGRRAPPEPFQQLLFGRAVGDPRRPSARKLGTASGSPPGAWGDSLSDPR